MGIRRKAREAALQFLFQEDFNAQETHLAEDLQDRLTTFFTIYQVNRQARSYAQVLLTGILQDREQVDELISKGASNWRLPRINATDRNILRIAAWEMLTDNDVPDQVAINEAVEIAKRFGSEESPSFINGVLDAVKTALRS